MQIKKTMEQLIFELGKWSSVYEFSFQFWGESNNNVFIEKSGIELISFGGARTIEDIIKDALSWCEKTNPKGIKPIEKVNRCGSCGCRIAKGNDFCGECLCED